MSLQAPEKPQTLQQALHAKAKGSFDQFWWLGELAQATYSGGWTGSHAGNIRNWVRGAARFPGKPFCDV